MAESLSTDALEWALKHIQRFGDSDFFPRSFEFDAITHCWNRIRHELEGLDLCEYRPKSPRRMVVPKSGTDFRVVAQLDPIDALVYTAMVYEVSELLEAARIPAERQIACSYRIVPDERGSWFPPTTGWPEFHGRSKTLAESGEFNFVVVADITDFYNQASQHRIENALEQAGVSESRAKAIEEFLSALSAKHSRGLPVGPSASIVLAEACMNDVDGRLLRRGLEFTRYVDDFRIFCRTYEDAVLVLHDLCDYLYTAHRLTLNASKTRIDSCEDFIERELRDPEEEEERGEFRRLSELIDELLESVGYDAFIESDSFDDLIDDDTKKKAIRDNIAELFEACVKMDKLHLGIARHLLRRASHLRTNVLNRIAIGNLRALVPVLRDVANYLKATSKVTVTKKKKIIRFFETDALGSLAFGRMWGIEIIRSIDGLADSQTAMRLAESSPKDIASRLEALVAERFQIVDWVRERKENWSTFGSWERRAVIFSASALPRDERNSWLGMIEEGGDSLDAAVASFVKSTASTSRMKKSASGKKGLNSKTSKSMATPNGMKSGSMAPKKGGLKGKGKGSK